MKKFKIPSCYWFPAIGGLCMGFVSLCLAPVSTQFMELFGVSYASLGLFLSGLFWSHAIIMIPAGIVIERVGLIQSLSFAAILILSCSLIPFINPKSLHLAFLMRFLMGIGTAVLFLSMVKALSMLAKPAQLVRGQGIQGAAFSFGSMLPYLILPLFGVIGWMFSYFLGAILAFCVIIALLIIPKKPFQSAPVKFSGKDIIYSIKKSLGQRELIIIGCLHGISFGSINAIANWLPLILLDVDQGNNIKKWSLITGGVFLAGTLGRLVGGELGRRYSQILIILFFSLAIACGYLLMSVFSQNINILICLGLGIGFMCGNTYASVFTLTTKIAARLGYTATGLAWMNTVATVLNILLIIFLGEIRERTGSFYTGLSMAGCLTFLVCAVGFIYRKKFIDEKL